MADLLLPQSQVSGTLVCNSQCHVVGASESR